MMESYLEYFFPVARFKEKKSTDSTNIELELNNIVGTAFAIGNNLYMTAWHVLEQAIEFKLPAIGLQEKDDTDSFDFVPIEEYEYHKEYDIAVFTVNHQERKHNVRALPWISSPLAIFHPVSSMGYPYSFDTEKKSLFPRGYSGNIVVGRTWRDRSNYLTANPEILEVSYISPRGLSGAPLIFNQKFICGVTLGNIGKYVEVVRAEHELTDEGLIIQETRFFHGFGISFESLQNLSFGKLIDTTFKNHLDSVGLLKNS